VARKATEGKEVLTDEDRSKYAVALGAMSSVRKLMLQEMVEKSRYEKVHKLR
jgi:hypothetical protein